MNQEIKPVLKVTYHVVAYDDVGPTGYGENNSRDFDNEAEAVAYARKQPEYLNASVRKNITMKPISIDIPYHEQTLSVLLRKTITMEPISIEIPHLELVIEASGSPPKP